MASVDTISDDSKRDLFMLGAMDAVGEHFMTHGPHRLHDNPHMAVLYLDFFDGEDVNIATHCGVDDRETAMVKHNFQGKLWYLRGRQAGDDIVTFLADKVRYLHKQEAKWWYRLGYRTEIFFGFLLDKPRSVWYSIRTFVRNLWPFRSKQDDTADAQDA